MVKMKKGWHQRKHKRTSIRGKKFVAGKDRIVNFWGWKIIMSNVTPKSQMHQASKDYKAILTKDGKKKIYEELAHDMTEFEGYVKFKLEEELREEKEKFKLSQATKKAFDKFDEVYGLPPMVYMDGDELEEEFRSRNKDDKRELLRDLDFIELWEEEMVSSSEEDDETPQQRIRSNKRILAGRKAHRKLLSLLKNDLRGYV
jgi:hypothetical protein